MKKFQILEQRIIYKKSTKNIGLEHFNLFHLFILKTWPNLGIYEQRTK